MNTLCQGCGGVIQGAFLSALGGAWHPACFVCVHCGQPIADKHFLKEQGRPCHIPCHHARSSPPCAICQGPIRTPGFVTDAWGNIFCESHPHTLPTCFGCGRLICDPITHGGVRYADGRHVCTLCRRGAVDDLSQAAPLLNQARAFLESAGLEFSAIPPVRLTSLPALLPGSGLMAGLQVAGMTRCRVVSRNGQVVGRELEGIQILYGLPREQFCSVAVHEHLHAWFCLAGAGPLPALAEEGVCVLAEHAWLQGRDHPDARYRLKILESQSDPLYGRGFQVARKAAAQMGLGAAARFLRERGRLPWNNPLTRLLGVV